MLIQGISFGARSVLKKDFDAGLIPLKRDITGNKLKKGYASIDHTIPKSKGGKTELCNLVLATRNNNHRRGAQPLGEVINWNYAEQYLQQFKNVHVENFNGNKYIEMIIRTIKRLIND